MNLELLLHFLKFNIESNDPAITEWIQKHYTSNDLGTAFPNRSASLTMRIERIDEPGTERVHMPTDPVFAETNLCNARCYFDGKGRFYAANDGCYTHEIVYDLNANTIRANVGGEFLKTAQSVVSNLVRPILQSFILPFYGLKTIHGAVLSKGERTILLAGHGGMGKTTTAVELMHSGYALLSDDGPFFFSDGDDAYTLSSLDYIHITENTLKMYPQLKGRVIGTKDSRNKYAVRLSDLQNGDALSQPHRITDYVQLRRGRDVISPRLTKIDKHSVHRSLLDESMVIFRSAPFRTRAYPFAEYSKFIFDVLTKVVQGAQTYELEFADHHLPKIHEVLGQL